MKKEWFAYVTDESCKGLIKSNILQHITSYTEYSRHIINSNKTYTNINYKLPGEYSESFSMEGSLEKVKKKIEKFLSDNEFDAKFEKIVKEE